MKTFAKLFETDNGQVLFALDYDDNEECREGGTPWVITARCSDVNGITPACSFKYHTEDARDSQFAVFAAPDALRVERELHKVVAQVSA